MPFALEHIGHVFVTVRLKDVVKMRVRGKQDDLAGGPKAARTLHELDAVHAGHTNIQDEQVDLGVLNAGERVGGRVKDVHVQLALHL